MRTAMTSSSFGQPVDRSPTRAPERATRSRLASRSITSARLGHRDPHLLAFEQLPSRIPREEDDDAELDALPARRVIEPVHLVRRGDPSRLADALWADDDVGQLEVDVREGGEQRSVEAGGTLMPTPDVARADELVDAVLGQSREQPGDVSPVLGERMTLPELSDLRVLGGVDLAAQQLAYVRH